MWECVIIKPSLRTFCTESYSTCVIQRNVFLVHWHFSRISESAFLQGRLRHFLGRSDGGHPALTTCWWRTTACLIRPPVGLPATGSQGQRLGRAFWDDVWARIGFTLPFLCFGISVTYSMIVTFQTPRVQLFLQPCYMLLYWMSAKHTAVIIHLNLVIKEITHVINYGFVHCPHCLKYFDFFGQIAF